MSFLKATQPIEFNLNSTDGFVQLEPYPGWQFVPYPDGSVRHEKIPEAAAGEDERWVDISQSQSRAIRNDTIEECVAALEKEASHNQRAADDVRDSLEMRARAERAMLTKQTCAAILRGMKK